MLFNKSFKFAEVQPINLILTFDFVSTKYFFPELPNLERKRVIGIQSFTSTDVSGIITTNTIPYQPIPEAFAREYYFTIYELGKDRPVIDSMPFLSCKKMINLAPTIPGGNIKPFDFLIDTRRSYAQSSTPGFQPYYLPFIFYANPIK